MSTFVAAPRERVFDLARSIDAHQHTTAQTGERAIAGRTSGLIGLDETVTWRARHLGMTRELTVRITGFERPAWFRDEQVQGPFAAMMHDHWFNDAPGGSLMREAFSFSAPCGLLGRIAELALLRRYLERFLRQRNAAIRRLAESHEWRSFLPGSEGRSQET